MAKPTKPSPELASWIELNAALMDGDLQLAERLLKEEQANKKRKQFMLRIHSRINKLRAEAEREALRKGAAE
jgi:hypothetical protein